MIPGAGAPDWAPTAHEAQCLESLVLAKALRLVENLGRNPLRKCPVVTDMMTRGNMLLLRWILMIHHLLQHA